MSLAGRSRRSYPVAEYLSEEAAGEVERGYRFTSKQLGGSTSALTERERRC